MERRRKTEVQVRAYMFGTILRLPILIPLWIFSFAWLIMTMPFRIRIATRMLNALENAAKASDNNTLEGSGDRPAN